MDEEIRNIGLEQIPYFRTEEFSQLMIENEQLMKLFVGASKESKVTFLTGSGTLGMEASIVNTLTKEDKALIVNGGSFGKRFVELCKIYDIPYDEIKLNVGEPLTKDILNNYDSKNYTAFIVNAHETSTGVLYDLNLIKDFCQKNNIFLIVDAISAFLTDEIDMQSMNIDILITSSQKALACPPGISILVLSERAVKKVYNNKPKCMYIDLKLALDNAQRGQTPFTPAVSILRQINFRLKTIEENGGVKSEIKKTRELAEYFRNNIKTLPLDLVTKSPSNAVTSLHPKKNNAYEIFLELKDKYNIWICPNGGDLKNQIFRVGHIGNLSKDDYDKLLDALNELNSKGIL